MRKTCSSRNECRARRFSLPDDEIDDTKVKNFLLGRLKRYLIFFKLDFAHQFCGLMEKSTIDAVEKRSTFEYIRRHSDLSLYD